MGVSQIPYPRDEVQKLRKEALEPNHLTRADCPFRVEKATNAPTAQAKEPTVVEALSEGITQEVPLIKQLQKTKADVSIWELILSSFEHRHALLQALISMNMSPDIAPNDVVAHVVQNPPRLVNAVTFSDEGLLSIGPKHGLAMYIAVTCLQKHVPMTLVDDGSAVNVLPLRTAHVLGLDKKDVTPTTQTVRAFDGTIHRVTEIVDLVVQTGLIERKVSCHVIDMASSFNLLLGRPWIHGVKALSSTLHRKIKIPLKGETVTIDATPIVVTGGDLVLEVILDTSNDDCGFEVIKVIDYCPELENMDLYTRSHVCETILKTGKYFGFSLYPRKEDTLVLKGVVLKGTTFGLGYEPTEQDLKKKRRTVTDRKAYPLTLNGYFVKAGEAERCLDFREPLFDEKSKKLVPGIEIFQDCHYIPEDVLSVTPRKAKLTPVEDGNALAPKGTISGWRKTIKWTDNRDLLFKMTTEEGEMLNPDDDSESESEVLGLSLKNRMLKTTLHQSFLLTCLPLDLFAYDSSPLHCNPISENVGFNNDFENEVGKGQVEEEEEEIVPPPQLVKRLEEYDQRNSVIEDTETINVGTTLEPRELKIGTTLDPTEKQGFIDLLNEFKDVFAWSYRDMPGIDREIEEHKIPIKPGFKPIKQKLRRMRTEWSLKVKEEIHKQLKAGFIKVSEYSVWVANVVPVPKKDGKVRVWTSGI
ncbi:uncharacterized protein LOC141620558 [Silene latifolia]|uniref:uncharacterized protein LOC141620558 n=1 Tax=Silene latifolia TaxID=37657 RepID=UPI003D7753B6